MGCNCGGSGYVSKGIPSSVACPKCGADNDIRSMIIKCGSCGEAFTLKEAINKLK